MSEHNDFLNTKASDVPTPIELPDGRYVMRVTGYSTDKTQNGNTVLQVSLKAIEAVETEEEVDLEKARNVQHKFYLTDKAAFIARDFFCKRLGLPEDETFGELAEASVNYEVGAIIKQNLVGKNKDIPKAEVARFVNVED